MLKIAIVGGGPASVSLCAQLYQKLKKLNANVRIEIIVFEKNSKIGYGLPYLNRNDCHILNLPKDIMEPLPNAKYVFSNWLKEKKPTFNNNDFPPRYYFGRYLEETAVVIQEKAKKINLNITYLTNHEVLNIKQYVNNKNIIYTNKKDFVVDFIILSTGHMPSTTYINLVGFSKYIHNPWDENVFSEIKPNATIGILGTRLTAIDILLKLKNNNHKGKICMASRSGLLPAVLSKNIDNYELKYLTLNTLQNLSQYNTKNRPIYKPVVDSELKEEFRNKYNNNLNIIMELFWEELSYAAGSDCNFDSIVKSSNDLSPLKWLNKEIRAAEFGSRNWQNMLFALYPITPYIWDILHTKDKHIFLDKYFSLFLTYLAAFPLDNAYKIRDILISGQLEICGHLNAVNKSRDGFVLSFDNLNSIKVDYLFNATGPGYDIGLVPLYRNMLDQKLIKKNPLGGIKIKNTTFQVIDENNVANPNVFAVGELAKGDCFFTTDLGRIVEHSDIVTSYLVKEVISRIPSFSRKAIFGAY